MDDKRIAIVSIIVEDLASAMPASELLHEYGAYIVGRMGLPYRERNISVICVVMDAPAAVVNGLCGRLGMLYGVKAKALFGKTV